jgi:hypothetical protein
MVSSSLRFLRCFLVTLAMVRMSTVHLRTRLSHQAGVVRVVDLLRVPCTTRTNSHLTPCGPFVQGLREYAEDDISICSGSMFSEGSLDTRSYLSAKTAVRSESYDELATLLSTYHLDNTSQLSNANSSFSSWAFATSYGRDPSCASSSASSACSSSGHSHGPCSSPSTLSNTSGVPAEFCGEGGHRRHTRLERNNPCGLRSRDAQKKHNATRRRHNANSGETRAFVSNLSGIRSLIKTSIV